MPPGARNAMLTPLIPFPGTPFPVVRILAVCISLFLISACTKPILVSEVQPDGSLEILRPGSNFATNFESGRWIASGDIGPGMLVVTEKQGKRALMIPAGEQTFTILRPVDANLLSTPYLEWSWLLVQDNRKPDYHDASILVGFHTSAETVGRPPYDNLPDAVDETPANQVFEIRWAPSALQRGELMFLNDGTVPFYAVRGGRENIGRWWREGIDLSALFTRLWPDRDLMKTHIVFIAIRAGKDRLNAPAFFADMRLFR